MTLIKLQEIITRRIKEGDPEASYVARLHKEGTEKILKKISEESFELILSGMKGNKNEIIREAADLLFHIQVLLAEKNIKIEEILSELDRRSGISGIEEKKSRKKTRRAL